jgi:hypothetical protein
MTVEVNPKVIATAVLMAYDNSSTVEDGLANVVRVLATSMFPIEPEPEWWEPFRGYQRRASLRKCLETIASELEDGDLV